MSDTWTKDTEHRTIDSPIGPLGVTVAAGRLHLVEMGATGTIDDRDDTAGVVPRLRAYFEGALESLDGIDVELAGTPFQRSVWAFLRTIPCGETVSYLDVAEGIGRPTSARAVGNAVGSNPVPLVVPCHRVIASGGGLGGFGGGLDRKRWLLAHEGAALQARSSMPALPGR